MTSPSEKPAPKRRALIVHTDAAEAAALAARFESGAVAPSICDDGSKALATLYNDPPDLIVVHQDVPPDGGVPLARALKDDNVFAHLPILLLVPPLGVQTLLAGGDYPFDDFIHDDAPTEDLLARASLCILRAKRQLDANPLTRLPGNNSIIKELETRLELRERFAAVYIDLDNFKAFNDRYGFSRGDEALKLTARLIVSGVSSGSPGDYFAGHVGGDDFIFIVPASCVKDICERFIKNFDALIASLYDDEERRQGFIRSTNRKGGKEPFPLMTI